MTTNINIKKNKKTEKAKDKVEDKAKDKVEDKAKDKVEDNLEFNESTINRLTTNQDIKKILCVNSICDDDNIAIAFLIKYSENSNKKFQYRCNKPNCILKKKVIWNKKPVVLLLHRINGKDNDMRISNLELVCPNCYMQEYGLVMFNKCIEKQVRKCRCCSFNKINSLSDNNQTMSICRMCINKQNKIHNNPDITKVIQMSRCSATNVSNQKCNLVFSDEIVETNTIEFGNNVTSLYNKQAHKPNNKLLDEITTKQEPSNNFTTNNINITELTQEFTSICSS